MSGQRFIPDGQTPLPTKDYDPQNEREYRREVARVMRDLGSQIPTDPVVSAIIGTFYYDGSAKITVIGNPFTKSIKCAVSTVAYPSTATVQAATATDGQSADFSFTGPYAMGDTLYVSALAYSGATGSGDSSDKRDVKLVVSMIQPTLLVTVDQASASGSVVTLSVKVTDPANKLTGNALVTVSFGGITSIEHYNGATWDNVTPSGSWSVNQTIGATDSYRITVSTTSTTGGYAKFVATKTGGYSGTSYWFGSGALAYTGCYARVTAVTATTVTVTVTATSVSGSPTVGLVGVTGSASLSSGHAAGTYTYAQNGTDNVWVFNRGSFQAGIGQAQFRSVQTGLVQDDDFVDIPEVGRDTVFLVARARVTATSATTVTVRVAVVDPFPQGAGSASIAHSYQISSGAGTVDKSSPQTCTPDSTFTEAAGTYVDYVVTRPAFASGTGRITFTATASSRIADSDAVDIPAQEQTSFGPSLDVKVTPDSPSAGSYRIVVTYDGTMTYKIDGGTDNNGTGSPQTIDVTQNAYGGATIVYVFKCVKDSQTVTNTVPVPALKLGSPTLSITEYLADTGASTLQVDWSVSGMPTGTTYDIFYNNGGENVGSVTGQSGTSYTFTSVTFAGSPGKGTVTVLAQSGAGTIAQKTRAGTYHV